MKVLHRFSGKTYTRVFHWQSTPANTLAIAYDEGGGFWASLEWLEPLDDEARDLFATVRSGRKPDREWMLSVRDRKCAE